MKESAAQTEFGAFERLCKEKKEGWEFLTLMGELLRYCLRDAWRMSKGLMERFETPEHMLKEMADVCVVRKEGGREHVIPVREEQAVINKECGLSECFMD